MIIKKLTMENIKKCNEFVNDNNTEKTNESIFGGTELEVYTPSFED